MLTLYTFGPSHFCEKARWALDLSGLPYREVRWAPGPHIIAARGKADASSVPILQTQEASVQGSSAIIDWIEAQGSPIWCTRQPSQDSSKIDAIEQRADAGIGQAVRRLSYATSLPTEGREIAAELFRGAVWWQQPLARLMWPISRQAIMKGLKATAKDVAVARSELERELDHLDDLVARPHRFILGDRLGRADIAVASLVSPLVFPAEHPVYGVTRPWNAQRKIIETYRDRPCVHWTAALYRDFRRPARDDAAPLPG